MLGAWILLWVNSGSLQRQLRTSGGWILGCPVSRVSLLLAPTLVTWLQFASFTLIAELGLWCGMGLHFAVHPLPVAVYLASLAALERASLLTVVLFPIFQLIMQAASFALRGWYSLLQFVIYGGLAGFFILLWKFNFTLLFTESARWHPAYYITLVCLLIIGVPTAAWFVKSASQNLHAVFTNPFFAEKYD